MVPRGIGVVSSIVSTAYGAVVGVRNTAFNVLPRLSKSAGLPTIGIGGIHAGGTGKTPVALLAGAYAIGKGYEVAFLSRGYRRKTRGCVISKPHSSDTWESVGDEPALLHASLPQSWLGICSNRYKSARALTPALSRKAAFILDDAFQHRQLKRDVDIACIPPGPLSDALLPGGTLREPVSGLSRAHCICVIGTKSDGAALQASKRTLGSRFPDAAIVLIYQTPSAWVRLKTGEQRQTVPLLRPAALCGIARPERFIFLLKNLGISLSAQSIFKDHHEYRPEEIESIAKRPGVSGIVTTEKDAVRLRSLKLVSWPDIWYLKIDLLFLDPESQRLFYGTIDMVLP